MIYSYAHKYAVWLPSKVCIRFNDIFGIIILNLYKLSLFSEVELNKHTQILVFYTIYADKTWTYVKQNKIIVWRINFWKVSVWFRDTPINDVDDNGFRSFSFIFGRSSSCCLFLYHQIILLIFCFVGRTPLPNWWMMTTKLKLVPSFANVVV